MTATEALEEILANGNRSFSPAALRNNKLKCADGFSLSVIAGAGTYSSPRSIPGPYRAVEVGYPSARPEPWADWEEYAESPDRPTGTVYGYVPVELVRALVASHEGTAVAK